jgi:hypothetical protein
MDDVWLLGPTPSEDLHRYSYRAFIPQSLHHQRARLILGETIGANGEPYATAYRDDEFQAAFVNPFLRVAEANHFPRAKPWLWVGPSGPHIIGKVVRELARQTGSMDPFSIDFDLRLVNSLPEGSLARQRYLEHVLEQAMHVIRREEIRVLVSHPSTLAAMLERLRDHERELIRGIYHVGNALTPEMMNQFRQAFPHAVHLAGYGNTLFGVVMEVQDQRREAMDFFPLGDRVQFSLALAEQEFGFLSPPRFCDRRETGRLLFHRLDQSCLLVNVFARDQAERIAPTETARELGGRADGFRNPSSYPQSQRDVPVTLH